METTEGLGRQAEVWVNGDLLTVCDGISPSSRRTPPGPLRDVEFQYVTHAGLSWAEAAGGNRSQRRRLDHVRGWSYVGYGRVISVLPVTVDFGMLTMRDANWSTEEGMVGLYVEIPIDRLEIVPSHQPDFPPDPRP